MEGMQSLGVVSKPTGLRKIDRKIWTMCQVVVGAFKRNGVKISVARLVLLSASTIWFCSKDSVKPMTQHLVIEI